MKKIKIIAIAIGIVCVGIVAIIFKSKNSEVYIDETCI